MMILRRLYTTFFYPIIRRKKLKDSDQGGKEGWIVEYKRKYIAELTNPVQSQKRWTTYDLTILEPSFKQEIYDNSFWKRKKIKFISKSLNEYLNHKYVIIRIIENKNTKHSTKVTTRGLKQKMYLRY